jgi:hypothetical protein
VIFLQIKVGFRVNKKIPRKISHRECAIATNEIKQLLDQKLQTFKNYNWQTHLAYVGDGMNDRLDLLIRS